MPTISIMRRGLRLVLLFAAIFIGLPIAAGGAWFYAQGWPTGWRQADWTSAGIAPDPQTDREAIVQVYSARTGRWKGMFAAHSWIVVKPRDADRLVRYDVVGWGQPVRRDGWDPDGRWYGNVPRVVREVRGGEAERLIPEIEAAIARYPYASRGDYRVWPGPNSNTFTAWVARQVPTLGLEMPAIAIGKDYLGDGWNVAPTPSGTGWQASWSGLFGATLAGREGFELNVLGATIGLDWEDLGIKLPSLGTISAKSVGALMGAPAPAP